MRVFLIPTLMLFLPLFVSVVVVHLSRLQLKQKRRRNPLTSNLLRTPGEYLHAQVDDLTQDITILMALMPSIPLMLYSVYLSLLYYKKRPVIWTDVLLYCIAGAAFLVYMAHRMLKLFNQRRLLRMAYEAEMAVGQELNQLMREGYCIFHDFPAEKFNIDHVVVGPTGVFAVETKARSKRLAENGKYDPEVIYDGQSLQFPGWIERKPLEQAKSQAEWMRKWLSSAVGEPVHVQPVLTLPGWYIKRVSSQGIMVVNPVQFRKHLAGKKLSILSEVMIKRIAHQLEQRCRNVEPQNLGEK